MRNNGRYEAFDVLLRRGIALLVETAVMVGLVVPVLAVVFGETERLADPPGTTISWLIAFGVFFCLRDLAGGGTSPMKRLLGLRVVSDRPGHRTARLALRNIIWVCGPNTWFIEFLASLTGARFGDRMVGTRVVDVAPERLGYWAGPLLLGAYFLPNLAWGHVSPEVIAFLQAL